MADMEKKIKAYALAKAKKDFKRFCNNWLASSKSLARSGANESSYDADVRVDRQIKERRKNLESAEKGASQEEIKDILKKGGWVK